MAFSNERGESVLRLETDFASMIKNQVKIRHHHSIYQCEIPLFKEQTVRIVTSHHATHVRLEKAVAIFSLQVLCSSVAYRCSFCFFVVEKSRIPEFSYGMNVLREDPAFTFI